MRRRDKKKKHTEGEIKILRSRRGCVDWFRGRYQGREFWSKVGFEWKEVSEESVCKKQIKPEERRTDWDLACQHQGAKKMI